MTRPRGPRRPTPSKDYHDYYIKDGVFIGEFDQMYQNVEDPWNIGDADRLDLDVALTLLRATREAPRRILDVGCGLGTFTNRIQGLFPEAAIAASDVSPTAVAKARARYPGIDFFVLDLNALDRQDLGGRRFDLIVMANTAWCVLPRLEAILRCFRDLLAEGGSLLLTEHFFRPGGQQYGNEYMETPADYLHYVREAGFNVLRTVETDRYVHSTTYYVAIWAKPGPRGQGT